MLMPLDGPSKQFSITLTSSVVVEVKITTALEERKVITIQPLDADIWVYFGDGINVPNVATVAADGFKHFKKAKESYEASNTQPIYILSTNASNDVRLVERA